MDKSIQYESQIHFCSTNMSTQIFPLSEYLEDHPRTCKWLGSLPFISHLGHLELEQPYFADLLTITSWAGMILQVYPLSVISIGHLDVFGHAWKKKKKLFSQMVLLKKGDLPWYNPYKNHLKPRTSWEINQPTNQPTNQEFWTNPVRRIHSLVKWWSNGTCGVSFWQRGELRSSQIKTPLDENSSPNSHQAVQKIAVPSLKLSWN